MTIRLLCIGTSLTVGGGWVEPLQAELQDWTPVEVQTVNRGIGGAASNIGVKNIANYIACDPSIVLMEFGMNDAHRAKGIEPAVAIRNAREIIDAVKAEKPGCIVILMTTNIAWQDASNPDHPGNRIDPDKLRRVYNAYHNMAFSSDGRVLRTIDLQGYFDALEVVSPTSTAPDGVHPTLGVWQSMIPHIAAVIGPILRNRGSTLRQVTSPVPPVKWTPVE